jgi:hypothetical protein
MYTSPGCRGIPQQQLDNLSHAQGPSTVVVPAHFYTTQQKDGYQSRGKGQGLVVCWSAACSKSAKPKQAL